VVSATEAASDQSQLTAKTSKVNEVILMLKKKGDEAALSAATVCVDPFAIKIMSDKERVRKCFPEFQSLFCPIWNRRASLADNKCAFLFVFRAKCLPFSFDIFDTVLL
jgi:hypothetical protein